MTPVHKFIFQPAELKPCTDKESHERFHPAMFLVKPEKKNILPYCWRWFPGNKGAQIRSKNSLGLCTKS